MRVPASAFHGNLMFTRSGVIWATWRLRGLPTGFNTEDIKEWVRAQHQALYQALRGEGLMLGLCASTDPVELIDAMLAGIDIREQPEWAEECALTMDQLEDIPLGERAFWISIPLSAGGFARRATLAWQAALSNLREQAALPRIRPRQDIIRYAEQAAKEIFNRIPPDFHARPSGLAEQVWIAIHHQHRGLSIDGPVPDEADLAGINGVAATQPPTAVPAPLLDEGGQSDIESKAKRLVPFNRRYLKVQSPYSEVPSYQVMQAVVGGPRDGWDMSVEWISRVEHYAIDVDWAIRFTVTPADVARRRNKRAEEQLNDQFDQQSGSLAITGGSSDLAQIGETLAALQAALNRSDKEVEIQPTIIFSVGGETAEIARARARYVADDYKLNDFLLEAPLGGQEELWWAMHPGVATTRMVRELAQITTGREFASGLPIVSNALGDGQGFRLGDNITTGRHTPILLDLHGNIRADFSASFAVCCELGGGKSTLMKGIGGDVLDRGGRLIAADRTKMREYAVFARSLTGKKSVVADILNPEWSLDPLRVWGPRKGARMVQSLFALMLDVGAMDVLGVALSALLEPQSLEQNKIDSLRSLMDHLESIQDSDETAKKLRQLMQVVASKDIGRVLFDSSLTPLDIDADAIVITTYGLELPDRAEVENSHLFTKLPLEKIFGRAMYAQIALLMQEFCFRESDRFALALVDEAHHYTASRDGEAVLRLFFRDGRKHAAAMGVASHDPSDFGDAITRGLIRLRFLLRHTDTTLAKRAIEWLGLPVTDAIVKEVTENLSPMGPDRKVPIDRRGEGLMRDARGRYGKFRKTLPARPHRRQAVLSTPSEAHSELESS